ncbi:MAG: hypothetical protein ACI9MC_002537 [Kiritimatiellia bacterium]|jgi:hypothetical protein
MSKWTGTLVNVDLGAGGFALQADDGKTYTLAGSVDSKLVGSRVTVKGSKVSAMGFLMTGDGTIDVKRVKAAR